jgi:hypothetical protein
MSPPIAILDTCVLVPYLVRDTLLRAARARLYQARWSNAILIELDRTLRESPFNLTDQQIQHLFSKCNGLFLRLWCSGLNNWKTN